MSGFLLDQNLSFRLLAVLKPRFPDSVHVGALRLGAASDFDIWDYARREELAILTKDSDFHHLSMLNGHPPKVVWLRVGNVSTTMIAELLVSRMSEIADFLETDSAAFYVLSA